MLYTYGISIALCCLEMVPIVLILLFSSLVANPSWGQALSVEPSNGVRGVESAICPEQLTKADQKPKLHTDYLRDVFGPTSVRIIRQTESIRIVEILAGGEVRTTAVSEFNRQLSPAVRAVHQKILAGGSMGQTFVAHGFSVSKRRVGQTFVELVMGHPLTANIYEFWAEKSGRSGPEFYARVAEINSEEVTKVIDPVEWTNMPNASKEDRERLLRALGQ